MDRLTLKLTRRFRKSSSANPNEASSTGSRSRPGHATKATLKPSKQSIPSNGDPEHSIASINEPSEIIAEQLLAAPSSILDGRKPFHDPVSPCTDISRIDDIWVRAFETLRARDKDLLNAY